MQFLEYKRYCLWCDSEIVAERTFSCLLLHGTLDHKIVCSYATFCSMLQNVVFWSIRVYIWREALDKPITNLTARPIFQQAVSASELLQLVSQSHYLGISLYDNQIPDLCMKQCIHSLLFTQDGLWNYNIALKFKNKPAKDISYLSKNYEAL